MKLLVISHTWHYLDEKGRPCGWSPTVIELDELAKEFDVIYHIACLKEGPPTGAERAYTATNIKFLPIPAYGGPGWSGKFSLIWSMPLILYSVFKWLKQVDVFQFRAPTSIGIYLIPALTFFSDKLGWFKYAGDWSDIKAPFSYRLQKHLLLSQRKRKVTVNGKWPGTPDHILSFDNPCLNFEDFNMWSNKLSLKKWNIPYQVCFIGRVDKSKGVLEIIETLKLPHVAHKIESFSIIGDGELLIPLQQAVLRAGIKLNVLGFSSRNKVFEILAHSHMLWLPSHGEGFPKVVAEACSQGCIPIVSNVSSIPQYIDNGVNGFVWRLNGNISFAEFVSHIIPQLETNGASIASAGVNVSQLFLHTRYKERLFSEIIYV